MNTSSPPKIDYDDAVSVLFEQQLDTWPMFAENYDRLGDALDNDVNLTEDEQDVVWHIYKMLLDYRKTSLGAKIDPASLSARPCFLCADNRPAEQRAVNWRDYEILVNPYPIADEHLTIPAVAHVPQRIKGRIRDMAAIARALPDRCVIYNGPKCGASAPDHMHFQAITGFFSINIWMPPEDLVEIARIRSARIYIPTENNSRFPYFIIQSGKDADLEQMFDTVYNALPPAEPEPMMNIAMIKNGSRSRTFIVPRRAHRPACYGTGEGQMLISPATIEMLGTFVTSRQEDFDRLDLQTVKSIYNEVCLTDDEYDEVIRKITGC